MKDFNIVITILMAMSFITLIIGVSIEYNTLVYIGLASCGIFHFIATMINQLFKE